MNSGLRAEFELRRADFTLSVRLHVELGEVVALFGPNGAGKSTVLGVLAGLLRPNTGFVELNGQRLTDSERSRQVPAYRRHIGLLTQNPLLFPHLNVSDNVAFGPRARGVGRREARQIAASLLSEVDALDLADRKPAQLSGGQAQRVAVARVLATEPSLLMLDEPMAAMDVDAGPAVRGLLRRVLRSTAAPTVLVTHDALDAVVLADRVLVLVDGGVVEQGPTRQLLANPRTPFTASIAGLNLVPGRAAVDGLLTVDGNVVAGQLATGLALNEPAVAVFPPTAVAVYREQPHGSPRNAFPVVLAGMEPRGSLVRLRASVAAGGPAWADGVTAEVTPAAVADLGLEPGIPVWFTVKATEVMIHPAAR